MGEVNVKIHNFFIVKYFLLAISNSYLASKENHQQ